LFVVLHRMSFVYPQFLFGLLALGIPIIIHLFNFRRAKKIYFSNNVFLQQVKKASSTRLKIKHLLILLSRLLFILFLVLTFAQPFLPADEGSINNNSVIIYLDNSYSMSNYVDENLTGFEAAISYIQSIMEMYPENTDIQFITNDFAPYSNVPKSKNEIRELITEISLSGISRSAEDIMDRIGQSPVSSGGIDIYWISDFQRSTAGSMEPLGNDTTRNLFLVPLFFNSTSNVYVDSLFLTNPFLIAGEKNELRLILRNDGNQEINDLLVRFYVNNVQTANGSVDIEPFGNGSISFDIGFQLEQHNRGRVNFEDFPVTFDNDFYFTLNLADRIDVIELKEEDGPTSIERVFGNETLFNFRSYQVGNTDYSDLQNANLIILNGIRELEPSISEVLAQFLQTRGDILLIPDENMDIGSYQAFGGSINNIPDSVRSRTGLSPADLDNPFFADIFESRSERFGMPSAVPVIRLVSSSMDLLEFDDGSKYLSYNEGINRLYQMASPLGPDFTDFSSHALFVPIMYRMAMLSKKEFKNLYYSLREPIVSMKIDSLNPDELIRLKKENTEIIPGQRISGNEVFLELPKHELNPGIYELSHGMENYGYIAFNQEEKESQLAQYSPEELRTLSDENSSITLFNTAGINNFDNEIQARYMGLNLWRYTLILALIFLLAEILIIRFL
ncbi:MAG: BatA domain-containing protein, partial [Cyclobacteriaceae bacterium]|nr:BatA domain-containing protein [Cyclobacteriaceae bacterium]